MPTFMAGTPFSLRLNGHGRTRCKRVIPVGDRTFKLQYSLPDTDEPAKDIHVSGNGLLYVRDVPVKHDGDVPCYEIGQISGTMLDVQFDVEDVRVQIFKEKKVRCGLLVDDFWAGEKKLVDISPEEIARGVEDQSVKGTLCHAPSIVPSVVIRKSLEGKPKLTIEVK